MTVQELMPLVKQLTRADKLRLMQSLLHDLAQEEGVDLPEAGVLLPADQAYPIWSPHTAFDAADKLLELLETDAAANA